MQLNRESVSVLADISNTLLSVPIRNLDLHDDSMSLPSSKTLGCVWETEKDRLFIKCNLEPLLKYTRRSMLSQLGQNFDPLGFGAPFFVKARLILQKLAIEGLDWDSEVPNAVIKEWNDWLRSLLLLKEFSLPRWYFHGCDLHGPGDVVVYQLHAFSDASNEVLSSVVYLRRLVNGVPCVAFVLGNVLLC